jgi:hypothetical protein
MESHCAVHASLELLSLIGPPTPASWEAGAIVTHHNIQLNSTSYINRTVGCKLHPDFKFSTS